MFRIHPSAPVAGRLGSAAEFLMYAIIEDSGSQRMVHQGDEILVDLMNEG